MLLSLMSQRRVLRRKVNYAIRWTVTAPTRRQSRSTGPTDHAKARARFGGRRENIPTSARKVQILGSPKSEAQAQPANQSSDFNPESIRKTILASTWRIASRSSWRNSNGAARRFSRHQASISSICFCASSESLNFTVEHSRLGRPRLHATLLAPCR